MDVAIGESNKGLRGLIESFRPDPAKRVLEGLAVQVDAQAQRLPTHTTHIPVEPIFTPEAKNVYEVKTRGGYNVTPENISAVPMRNLARELRELAGRKREEVVLVNDVDEKERAGIRVSGGTAEKISLIQGEQGPTAKAIEGVVKGLGVDFRSLRLIDSNSVITNCDGLAVEVVGPSEDKNEKAKIVLKRTK